MHYGQPRVVRDRPLRRSRTTLGALSAFLPLAWLCAFFVGPLIITLVYAFAHPLFGGERLGFTLGNFRSTFSGFYLTIFFRTMEFAAIGTFLCMVVATPLAYFLARKVHRFKLLLLILLLVPFWTSFLIRTLAWRTLLAADGPIRDVLNFAHLHHGLLYVLDTQTAVRIGLVYAYLPLMALPLFVAFERIPEEMLEASRDLSAGSLRTFVFVTLPAARGGFAAGLLLTFVPMTGEYVVPALLGGDRGVLMSGLIADQYLQAQNYPLGSAMAIVVLAVVGVAVFVLTRVTGGFKASAA